MAKSQKIVRSATVIPKQKDATLPPVKKKADYDADVAHTCRKSFLGGAQPHQVNLVGASVLSGIRL
jgi:hypothetical protein